MSPIKSLPLKSLLILTSDFHPPRPQMAPLLPVELDPPSRPSLILGLCLLPLQTPRIRQHIHDHRQREHQMVVLPLGISPRNYRCDVLFVPEEGWVSPLCKHIVRVNL